MTNNDDSSQYAESLAALRTAQNMVTAVVFIAVLALLIAIGVFLYRLSMPTDVTLLVISVVGLFGVLVMMALLLSLQAGLRFLQDAYDYMDVFVEDDDG